MGPSTQSDSSSATIATSSPPNLSPKMYSNNNKYEPQGYARYDRLTMVGKGESAGPPPSPTSAVVEEKANPLYQPKTLKFWMTLVCNFMALFLVALDRTIIATAVPRISDDFHAIEDVGWYAAAYMLTTSCAQLVYGRIYKFYNMKWVFLISLVVFEVGSTICGAAPSSTIFIIGRAVAGVGSAGIFSGCMLIMIPMIPLHRRPMFQSLFGLMFGVASVMGPLLGGAFASVSWRWCFWINLPIGGVTFVFMIFWWNPPAQHFDSGTSMSHFQRLDPLGLLFLLPSVVCLLLGLQWAGTTYAWDNWRIILLFVMFGVLLGAFVVVQTLKPDTAVIPGRVIRQRSVAFGTGFTFFIAGSMLMLVYYVPIWLQTVQEVSPLQSGILTLPLVAALVVSSILAGISTQKLGYYVPSMLLAPSIMSVGTGLMSTWSRSAPRSHWIAYQFIAGFGLGFGMQQSALAIQAVLPPTDIPTGIAINFFVQQLGGAVFTTLGQTLLTNLLSKRLAGIPGTNVVGEGLTNLLNTVPAQYLDQVIEAYNYACSRIFLTAMGLAFAALLCASGMEWKNIKKGRNGAPGAPPVAAGRNPARETIRQPLVENVEMMSRSPKGLAQPEDAARGRDSRSTFHSAGNVSRNSRNSEFAFDFPQERRYTRSSRASGAPCRHCGHC